MRDGPARDTPMHEATLAIVPHKFRALVPLRLHRASNVEGGSDEGQ
jgi:hypothetical protein